MSQTLETVAQAVFECQQACNDCFDACLQEEEVNHLTECIHLDRECADICGVVANFAAREGAVTNDLISICATICKACGDECAKHADHHEHCRKCAAACENCAQICREYLDI